MTTGATAISNEARGRGGHHFGGGLKNVRSGGGWSFLVGISRPSALL